MKDGGLENENHEEWPPAPITDMPSATTKRRGDPHDRIALGLVILGAIVFLTPPYVGGDFPMEGLINFDLGRWATRVDVIAIGIAMAGFVLAIRNSHATPARIAVAFCLLWALWVKSYLSSVRY